MMSAGSRIPLVQTTVNFVMDMVGEAGAMFRPPILTIQSQVGFNLVNVASDSDKFAGIVKDVNPSWAFHKAHVHRWISDFGVGGLRLDSVNNIANYEFVRSYKEHAIAVYQSKHNNPPSSKFLVIGEELSCPLDLIQV